MTLDLDGMEKYAQDASESLEVISQSLQAIVNNPNLSDEQQLALNQMVESINKLADNQDPLHQLPQALDQSALPLSRQAKRRSMIFKPRSSLRWLPLSVIIIALTAIYLLILKPMQQTLVKATNNISSMAQSIQITAEASSTAQKTTANHGLHWAFTHQCTDK